MSCTTCTLLDTKHCYITIELLDKLQGIGITGLNCPNKLTEKQQCEINYEIDHSQKEDI